jgi:hypothetical protein
MRAADLLGCVVHDAGGEVVGHVHDLRFEARATPGSSNADDVTYRLTGLQCGTAAVGHRLGYGHGDMAGPWLLRTWFRRARRSSLVVEWRDIVRFERPDIYIARRRGELRSIEETDS